MADIVINSPFFIYSDNRQKVMLSISHIDINNQIKFHSWSEDENGSRDDPFRGIHKHSLINAGQENHLTFKHIGKFYLPEDKKESLFWINFYYAIAISETIPPTALWQTAR